MHEWHSNLPRFLNVFSKKLKSNANNASLSHLKMMMTNYNSTRFLSFIFFCWRIAFSVSCSKFPLSPNIMVNCIYTTNLIKIIVMFIRFERNGTFNFWLDYLICCFLSLCSLASFEQLHDCGLFTFQEGSLEACTRKL